MKIDAHQHFWAIDRGDYGWLTPELTKLYRDFGPGDLTPMLREQGIDGTVLVQAAPTVDETRYMLGIAANNDFVKGVVGWADFESNDAASTISSLAQEPKLVGLRPMIQDIADTDWMLKDELDAAFAALIESNLTFDALTLPRHLPNLKILLGRYPQMRVVVDHGSKPHIAEKVFEPWASDVADIAKQSTAFMKLSGLVTEAAENWTIEDLKPYVGHLFETFGPDRIIWGSDWPVCTLASSYERWCETTEILISDLNEDERKAVFGGNAQKAYKLEHGT